MVLLASMPVRREATRKLKQPLVEIGRATAMLKTAMLKTANRQLNQPPQTTATMTAPAPASR